MVDQANAQRCPEKAKNSGLYWCRRSPIHDSTTSGDQMRMEGRFKFRCRIEIQIEILTPSEKTLFISPRNPVILNLGLLQQAHVHSLLYADVLRTMAIGLQKFDPAMCCKQVPSMTDLLKTQAPPYRFDGSFAELKDERCLILHSSGSTGRTIKLALTPTFS